MSRDCTMAGRFFIRQTLENPIHLYPLETLVPHPVQNHLLAAINFPLCGLFVHWAVPGAGKTAYARFAARQAQQNGRLVGFFSASEIPRDMKNNQLAWLRREVGISPLVHEPLARLLPPRPVEYKQSSHVPPPVSIVIDQIDHLRDLEDTRSFLVGLAEASRNYKLFNVTVCATAPEFAKEILLWNCGEKIHLVGAPGCGRWNEEHVRSFVNGISGSSSWAADRRERLIELGKKAGTPSFVMMAAAMRDENWPALEQAAVAVDEEWKQGIALLEKFKM